MTKNSIFHILASGIVIAVTVLAAYQIVSFAMDVSQVREVMITPHERSILRQFEGDY